MNVMAMSGHTDVDVTVTLHDIPVGVGGVPPEVQIGDKILELHFKGPYCGVGTVLAVGWRSFFLTSDFIFTSQVLEAQLEDQDDDTVKAFSLAPRLGYHAGSTDYGAVFQLEYKPKGYFGNSIGARYYMGMIDVIADNSGDEVTNSVFSLLFTMPIGDDPSAAKKAEGK